MSDFRNTLRSWRRQSRDSRFLTRATLVVLSVFGVVGIVLHHVAAAMEGGDGAATGLTANARSEGGPEEFGNGSGSGGADGVSDGGAGSGAEGGDGRQNSPFGFDFDFEFEPERSPDNARAEAFDQLLHARDTGDWRGVIYWALCIDLMDIFSPLLVLSLVVGLVWAIIVAQFCGFDRRLLLLYAGALGLGMVSATVTLIVVELQTLRGFIEGEDFRDQMIFWIAGVGLREELVKLACFVPLLIILRRKSEIDALVCGALVGLGFAIQENVTYYMASGVGDAFGRMMTANFLHLALTGFAARALYRLLLRPRRHWEEFLATFLVVVVVHGLYDAFPSVPELQGFDIMSLVILAVMSYYFCELLGRVGRHGSGLSFAPMAVLVIGMATITGSVYLFGCLLLPPLDAALLSCGGALGMFPFLVMFIHRLRNF